MPRTRTAAKIFSPFAYMAFLLAAFLAVLLTGSTLNVTLGSDAPIYLYIGAELLVGGAVLFAGGWALLSLEELQRPGVLDHLRRCAFLYLVFVPSGVSLIAFVNAGDPGGGGSLAILLCGIAAYASLLFLARRRTDGLQTGRYT